MSNEKSNKGWGPGRTGIIVTVALVVFVLFAGIDNIWETNDAGNYHIKQSAYYGEMSVINQPGVFTKAFGDVFNYRLSDMYYFSKHDLDGGAGAAAGPIKVRFNDGSIAEVSGSIKFKLSQNPKNQLELHEEFRGYGAVQQDMVRQVVSEALKQTATLMKAEESYSTRRSEFTAVAERQINEGIFETVSDEFETEDAEGNKFIERSVKLKIDEAGNTVVRKPSPFIRYEIATLQFVIKDIDFDDDINNLITQKKKAEQAKIVAKAQAEEAKQDAITAEAKGAARIATALAEEEEAKIRATTQAKKDFEVAQYNKKKAKEDADAELISRRADAEANKLLVQAGLTPRERAEFQMKTAIGVAGEMAKIELPKMMIFGGGKGSPLNPFEAVGLESFHNLTQRLSNEGK